MSYTWFQILWFFFLYAFLGWCTEVAFQTVRQGKFVNRGFVNGPVCSIYGFGVLSVLLVLEPLKSNFFVLFFGSVLFTSMLEFVTGWVLERVFHDKWWDYTKRPLNIKGYVCAEFSLAWGAACVFVVDVFHPLVVRLVSHIPHTPGWVLLGLFGVTWTADHVVTIIEVLKLPKRLRAIQAIEDALTKLSDQFGENVVYRGTANAVALTEDARRKLEAERAELLRKREALLSRRNIVHERILQAFPDLREGRTYGRAFTRMHEFIIRRKKK